MANSPVQIVLNAEAFIEAIEHSGGGGHKDFFAGNDEAFIAHRDAVQQQLEDIKGMQLVSSFSQVSFAKIVLQQDALAKSHRPTTRLFRPDVARIVGAGDLGELFVELTPNAIDTIIKKVSQAEDKTRYKEVDGKSKPNPSPERSEVGAIKEIIPVGAGDKRKFALRDGLQWLASPLAGGTYLVELFEQPPLRQDWDLLDANKLSLFKSFFEGLEKIGPGLVASSHASKAGASILWSVRLENTKAAPIINLIPSSVRIQQSVDPLFAKELDLNENRHGVLLHFLDHHPLVKKVFLPPVVLHRQMGIQAERKQPFSIEKPNEKISYPQLAIVDGGVARVLGDWVKERLGYLHADHRDESHGTFIAGLAVCGQTLNGPAICQESDGCKIIDLDLLPTGSSFHLYYQEPLDFFVELEAAVRKVVASTGVRIFNFSLNYTDHASTTGYSVVAQKLDEIAEKNDVIFVISAGNTDAPDHRKEWPSDPIAALNILAEARNDTIRKPAESCRNLSVSALNPPDLESVIPFALSRYSCRGPGLRVGLKPDLSHIGGSGTKPGSLITGLQSITPSGKVVDGCGTSYAAPQVARILASLDHSIEGLVSRETLIALVIHHATPPNLLQDKRFRRIQKHLVGFGMPKAAEDMLNGNDSNITLVFASRIINRHKMSFRFSWPSCLVRNGKCFGHARLTIVSTPEFNHQFGAEFVRVNVDAALRQMQRDGKYKGRLKAIYTPEEGDGVQYEKEQIDHSFKWSPVKVYEKAFKGVGPTTDWALEVECLTRDGATFPRNGIPFTAILTISDPTGNQPVFNDVRQMLQSAGVNVVDIQTAARVVSRV